MIETTPPMTSTEINMVNTKTLIDLDSFRTPVSNEHKAYRNYKIKKLFLREMFEPVAHIIMAVVISIMICFMITYLITRSWLLSLIVGSVMLGLSIWRATKYIGQCKQLRLNLLTSLEYDFSEARREIGQIIGDKFVSIDSLTDENLLDLTRDKPCSIIFTANGSSPGVSLEGTQYVISNTTIVEGKRLCSITEEDI